MKKILGFLAVVGMAFIAMPSQPASALSLASPAGAASTSHASANAITDVHWRRGGRHRGWHHRRWRRW